MKKYYLLFLMLFLLPCSIFAYDFAVDGIYYNVTSSTSKTVTVTSPRDNSYTGIVHIPDTVVWKGKTYSVTKIEYRAFKGCGFLTEVTIGNRVTEIGSYAFYFCRSLTEVTIPNSVKQIRGSAFEECNCLTEVTIGNSVTYIGGSAFKGCSRLTEVTIPNSVTEIEDEAFEGCSSLTHVTIGNSVITIGSSAFEGCSSLTHVTIGNSVIAIGSSAFEGCSSLTKVTIPNSVTEIGSSAFYGCSSLTEVTIPNSVTYIGRYSFSGCSSLTKVTIGNSVTYIGDRAFEGCSSLTHVTIPNSVTVIKDYAFEGCSSLTKVTISDGDGTLSFDSATFKYCPIKTLYLGRNFITSYSSYYPFKNKESLTTLIIGNSVTKIEDEAFEGCTSISSVVSLNPIPPVITTSTFDKMTEQNATLHVPEGCKTVYWLHPYWENFFNIQDDAQTADISSVSTDSREGRDKKDDIYTLNGIKVNTTNVSDLPKGIYIINGKKRVVK